jgi:hypothetical protein
VPANYNPIDHVQNMTLYIRVNALFPAFDIAVQSLVFDAITAPGAAPGVISLNKLLEMAGVSYESVQLNGNY